MLRCGFFLSVTNKTEDKGPRAQVFVMPELNGRMTITLTQATQFQTIEHNDLLTVLFKA